MRIIAGPYLQNVSKDAITVMWQTDMPGSSIVEYERSRQLGWSAYDVPPPPTYPEQATDLRPVTIHAVRLEGLDEDWTYFYRVRAVGGDGREVVSPGAALRSAPPDASPFSFATYGDDMGLQDEHRRNALNARASRADIFVGAGDMAQDVIGRYQEHLFEPAAELMAYTPWYSTMGNHDSPNEGFFRFFCFPEPRYWYSFNYGCAHFSVLNTCMDYRPGSEQWAWLDDDLRRFREARWRFVVFHHPPYCSNNCEIPATRILCPLFERHGVDIVYNAHATIYERFHPVCEGRYDAANGVIYFVSGGGGYDMSLSPSQLWDHTHRLSACAYPTNHFLHTHVAPDEVSVRAIATDGRVLDTLTLRKGPGECPSLPEASPQRPYPHPSPDGTVVAGLPEGPVRWVLPWPVYALDADVTRASHYSVRCQWESRGPVWPALRRVLRADGKALDAVAGRRYRVSAWARTQGVRGGTHLSFEWSGDMGFLGRAKSEPLAGTNDWTLLTVTTPELPPYVYWCRALCSAEPGTTGTAWFEDVTVEQV